jgi:hypothetical protein
MSKPKTGRAIARAEDVPLREWAKPFLAALAETSNVTRAAKAAGINNTAKVYEARRTNRAFAREWQAALAEGYDNLEMDLLCRLREGEIKRAAGAKTGVRTYDNATAFRLLMVHREARAKEQAQRTNVSAAEVRASIDRKLAALKAKVLAEREAQQAADD